MATTPDTPDTREPAPSVPSAETPRRAWGFESYGPLAGFVAVALWLTGALLLFQDEPADAGGSELVAWFEDSNSSILLGLVLLFYGSGAFVWFAASLRSRILVVEAAGRLATLVFAGAFGVALATIAGFAPLGSAALMVEDDGELSAGMAEVFYSAGDGFFIGGQVFLLILLLAVGVASLRLKAFPTWFGVLSLVVALPLLFPPIGWVVLIFGLPAWTLVAAFLVSWDAYKLRPRTAPDATI